jgi:glycosyltransferase involved in cell wall biosynthesis
MRVLMLTSSYPKYAGETTAPFIEEIAASLVRRGHEVHVLAPFQPDIRRAPVERGVHLRFFRYAPHPALNVWGYAGSQRGDVRLKAQALAVAPFALAATIFAALHATQPQSSTTFRPSPFAFDLLHAHWLLPNGTPAALVAALRGLPLVVSLHGSDVALAERHWLTAAAAGVTLRAADAITACSADLHARALRLGAPCNRARVLPYGVDPQAFCPRPEARDAVRAELGLAEGQPLVLTLGRLVYKKGFGVLLDAWPAVLRRHPGARLAIVGDGDLRDELAAQSQALGIADSVRFTGQLPRARTSSYLASADVFVVPSVRDQSGNVDGLPNTLLEGMGTARPIVATRLAGIPQVIDDGTHGLLVPERDAASLAGAISRLLDDGALAARLGANARRRIERELTWDATASLWEATYQSALDAHAR